MLSEGEWCDPVSKRLHHKERGTGQKKWGVRHERDGHVGSV